MNETKYGESFLRLQKRSIAHKLFCLEVLTAGLKASAYVEDYKEDSVVLKRLSWICGQQHCIPRFMSIYNIYQENMPKTGLYIAKYALDSIVQARDLFTSTV